MHHRPKPQLLAPAGSVAAARAALNNGCDAIYIGGKQFSARSYADNASDDELIELIDLCHVMGVKVYIAVNTLYKTSELDGLFHFVSRMYEAGADAFIMQDIGAAMRIREVLPNARLHASTQMTAHSLQDVLMLEQLGFCRVVLARELSLQEIADIRQGTTVELEVFVHGALCVSYSGRCLMSSMLGGRSGNRGRCAQPCRLPYGLYRGEEKAREGYLLSPKDLMTLEVLPKLIEAGVDSLKIEGRMKNPAYVALATREYREAVDTWWTERTAGSLPVADSGRLAGVFNRGGSFTSGYAEHFSGKDMMSTRSPKSAGVCVGVVVFYDPKSKKCVWETRESLCAGDGVEIWTREEPHVGCGINKTTEAGRKYEMRIEGRINKGDLVYRTYDKKLNDELQKTCGEVSRQMAISGTCRAYAGGPLLLILEASGVSVQSEGPIVQEAQASPMSGEELRRRLSKTGGTPFRLDHLACETGDSIYIPIAEINSLRRQALALLQEKVVAQYKRLAPATFPPVASSLERQRISGKPKAPQMLTVMVRLPEQLLNAVQPGVHRIYWEEPDVSLVGHYTSLCHQKGIELFAALPFIDRNRKSEALIAALEETEIDGFLARTYGQLSLLAQTDKKKAADDTLPIFNNLSRAFLEDRGLEPTLSAELNLTEIDSCGGGEIVIYGRLPLMMTHQCPVGLYAAHKDDKPYCALKNNREAWRLRDRKGVDFPIETHCEGCYAIIRNSRPVFILNKTDGVTRSAAERLRLVFTEESAEEVKTLVEAHLFGLCAVSSANAASEACPAVLPAHEYKRTIGRLIEAGVTGGHLFRGVE